MNESTQPNAAPDPASPGSPAAAKRSRNPIVRRIGAAVLLLLFAFIAWTIYVAVHRPDPQETVILGQTALASGSPAALRILVRNCVSGKPIKGAEVRLSLMGKSGRPVDLGRFRTDASGSIGDSIAIPDLVPGEYQLVLDSTSSVGRDHVVKKVEIRHLARILLSSDKPLYQPGQTIHLRSLAINGRTQKPYANESITFEIADAKGNKVFKETRKTSAFGIASADFLLASELNLGRYELRAIAGATTAERTVKVKRYVLPKFKIQIATDQPYYLPGQTVFGSVQADYFFGQPVANATVKLTAGTFEEKPRAIFELRGQTDSTGKYSFQFVLPDFFAGLPQKNGQAFLDLTAEVRDTGQHIEEKTLSISVAQNELEITAIPEAGAFVQGVENTLYILTAYPDGRPALCEIFINGKACQADAQGACEFRLAPDSLNQPVEIQAVDPLGKKAKLTFSPETTEPSPPFLLRVDQAVYQAGQTAHVILLSLEQSSTVFLDVIKDGQTVLTKSVPLKDHRAEYALALPASLVGVLKLNAYMITATGEDRGCSRMIYVNPASGLKIATKLSKPVFRPGEIGRVDFSVTDADGRPAPAALGIAAVDESVFALQENRPGLLKQFLDVEGNLLKPRYQIKFFDSPERLFETENQTLAKAYLASLEEPHTGHDLNELLKQGYIDQRVIDHARSLRGTKAYEHLRNEARFAGIVQLLEGEGTAYNLRETTGPVKLAQVEAYRRAYFNTLGRYAQNLCLGLLFLSPIFLLIYYSRQTMAPAFQTSTQLRGRMMCYSRMARSVSNCLAALTLLPFICYPIGFMILDQHGLDECGWVLLVFETLVVLVGLTVQSSSLIKAGIHQLKSESASLCTFLAAFLCQFVVSRLGFLSMMFHDPLEWFGIIWFIVSIFAPLILLGVLGSHVRRQLVPYGITERVTRNVFLEVLIIVAILCVLAGLLLPALAKAKAKAVSISLMNDLRQVELANQMAEGDDTKPAVGSSFTPRVRRDFPETLLWQPELITDDRGQGALEFPLADSITTWRASIDGVSAAGRMGSVEMPIPVFQDFFVDLDLPVSMSLNDEVSVPVTCYNYLKKQQDIQLKLAAADWLECPAQNLSVQLGPNEVKSVSFPIKVLRVGNHSLRVTAQGATVADAIEREVRVVPTGERIEHTQNGVLKDVYVDAFTVFENAVPDSASLQVKFYPSRFSEVVEGLESIFQAPYGCFEQTSSRTYPNVLVLDYLKRMAKVTPEIEITARKFINAGYQRLLTFEVPGGGFEWFGRNPANICLTAYGILEFTDMSRVHPVDEAVIERARKWLFAQQNGDGSWDEIHRGWTWEGRGSMTAFVAWALAESGDQSASLDRALNYLRAHPKELANTYAQALAANAFLARDRNDSFGRKLASEIKATAEVDSQDCIHWGSTGYSITYSHDSGMESECTALCTMALMKAGEWPQSVKQGLTWISSHKFADGTHGSTQATILSLRALLEASTLSIGQDFTSSVTLLMNGKPIQTVQLNKENSDVMRQFDLAKYLHTGENRLEFRQNPPGELPFQIAGACWLPSQSSPNFSTDGAPAMAEPLEINLQYDRARLAVNDQLKCAVTVKNNTRQLINMAIVDLGIPPGFDVDSSAFEAMQQTGQISKFELTGNQVILYLREISESAPFEFSYSLRAKYPLRVQTPPSTVYEYYQPQNRARTTPVTLVVVGSR